MSLTQDLGQERQGGAEDDVEGAVQDHPGERRAVPGRPYRPDSGDGVQPHHRGHQQVADQDHLQDHPGHPQRRQGREAQGQSLLEQGNLDIEDVRASDVVVLWRGDSRGNGWPPEGP